MKTPLTPKISTVITPRIEIDYETYQKVKYLVDKAPQECQWYHRVTVDRTTSSPVYILTDIFIPPQQVGKTDVESDPTGIKKMWEEYGAATNEAAMKEGMRETKAWCHSHVNMKVEPSEQDEKQWKDWIKSSVPSIGSTDSRIKISIDPTISQNHPPVMIIVNKQDEWFARVFDPVLMIQFDSLPVHVIGTPSYPDIDAAIAKFEVYKEPKKEKPVITTPPKHLPGAYPGSHSSSMLDWGSRGYDIETAEDFFTRYNRGLEIRNLTGKDISHLGTSTAGGSSKGRPKDESSGEVVLYKDLIDYCSNPRSNQAWTLETLKTVHSMYTDRKIPKQDVLKHVAEYLKLQDPRDLIVGLYFLITASPTIVLDKLNTRESHGNTQYHQTAVLKDLYDYDGDFWTIATDQICKIVKARDSNQLNQQTYKTFNYVYQEYL